MGRLLITSMLCILLLYSPTYAEGLSLSKGNTIRGVASWYSKVDPGILRTTANMEIFNDQKLTCAMWGVPFNTMIKITNLANGKSVVVRVNDRGPAERLVERGRVIDLAKGAFFRIAELEEGLIPIEPIILPPPCY